MWDKLFPKIKVEYKKEIAELKLDPQVFPLCIPKREEFKKGFKRKKKVYYVHRFPEKWDILIISDDNIERHTF